MPSTARILHLMKQKQTLTQLPKDYNMPRFIWGVHSYTKLTQIVIISQIFVEVIIFKQMKQIKTQTCMQEYASAGKVFSMFNLLNGCYFCTKLWAFSPFPPLSYTFKALHQSSLHENVVFYICARMCNAAYIIFIMRDSISSLDTK